MNHITIHSKRIFKVFRQKFIYIMFCPLPLKERVFCFILINVKLMLSNSYHLVK